MDNKMCILFIYNGSGDVESDYSFILITNRDEYYDRATQNMTVWSGDPVIVAGRDLQVKDGGTWLAISPTTKKLGVLLNLPGVSKQNPKSRGKVVVDYVKNKDKIEDHIENMKKIYEVCNEFVMVAVEFDKSRPAIYSYSNANNQLVSYDAVFHGFGNSLPETPLKKVEAGRVQLEQVCSKFHKESDEKELLEHLLELLKSEQSHLPDEVLEKRQPNSYKELSSIYVCAPKGRYGTRTHTITLLTKKGRLSVTEITQRMPIDPENPIWDKFEYNTEIKNAES